jgi:hypothetical protein
VFYHSKTIGSYCPELARRRDLLIYVKSEQVAESPQVSIRLVRQLARRRDQLICVQFGNLGQVYRHSTSIGPYWTYWPELAHHRDRLVYVKSDRLLSHPRSVFGLHVNLLVLALRRDQLIYI